MTVGKLAHASVGTQLTQSEYEAEAAHTVNGIAFNLTRTYIIVAAYNASDQEKALADYVCDGTADDVEINTALALQQGPVHLTRGTYNLNSYIWEKYSYSWLEGSGMATLIIPKTNMNDDCIIISSDPDYSGPGAGPDGLTGCVVRNLYIDANGFNQSASGVHGGTAGIWDYYANTYTQISGVYIYRPYGVGFFIDNSYRSVISNCFCDTGRNAGYEIYGGGEDQIINSSAYKCLHGLYTQNGYYNTLMGFMSDTNYQYGIHIYQDESDVVAGYRSYNQVIGCTMRRNAQHGLRVEGSQGNSFIGCNILSNSCGSVDTYYGAYLTYVGAAKAMYNKFDGCNIGNEPDSVSQKYGYCESSADDDYNSIVNCTFFANVTANLNVLGAHTLELANIEI